MGEMNNLSYPIDEHFADTSGIKCPILFAMDLVGSKWKLPILWYLHEQEGTRYNELRRRVRGITNTMLTKSLRELESDGIVRREEEDSVPPKVKYYLTEDGEDLLPALNDLYAWGKRQQARRALSKA